MEDKLKKETGETDDRFAEMLKDTKGYPERLAESGSGSKRDEEEPVLDVYAGPEPDAASDAAGVYAGPQYYNIEKNPIPVYMGPAPGEIQAGGPDPDDHGSPLLVYAGPVPGPQGGFLGMMSSVFSRIFKSGRTSDDTEPENTALKVYDGPQPAAPNGFCPVCGGKILKGQNFCMSCGAKLPLQNGEE